MARNIDIRLRRSSVAGNIPTVEQLNLGELAINTADGKLYLKKQIDGIEQVIEVGADARAGLVSTFNTYIYTSDGTLQTLQGADDYGNFLSYDLSSPRRIQVYLNGVLLHQGIDYTSPDGETINFTYAIDEGQVVQVAAYNSDGASIDADLILDDGFSFTVGTDEETKLYHNGANTILKHMAYGDNTFKMMWRDSDRLVMGENGIDLFGNLTINGNTVVTDSDVLTLIGDTVTNAFVEDLDLNASAILYDNSSTTLVSTNVQQAIDELYDEKLDITALSSSVVFYPTTAASDVAGHNRLVTSQTDSDYDTAAVAVNTGTIITSDQLAGQLVSDPGVLEGSTGVINIHTVGNIRQASGNSEASFYFEVLKLDSNGVETSMGISNVTRPSDNDTYEQFFADALIESTTFTSTDRVILRFFANDVGGGANSSFDFQFGGAQPIRSNFPVPVNVIPHDKITDDIPEGNTNLYFTAERARQAISGTSGISYDPNTGIITADTNILATRNYAETYAEMVSDSDAAATLIEANDYTDTELGLLESSLQASFDSDLLLTQTTLQGNIDSAYSNSIAYADTVASQAVTTAESYTDSAITIAITNLVDGAPDVLDTLNELAAALGDDSDFIGTVQNWINQKLDKTATTDEVDEGTSNQYFTEQRARESLSAGNGLLYNPSTGEFALDSTYDAAFNTVTANTFVGDLNGTADNSNLLDGQQSSHYRINVYDQTGTLLN